VNKVDSCHGRQDARDVAILEDIAATMWATILSLTIVLRANPKTGTGTSKTRSQSPFWDWPGLRAGLCAAGNGCLR
jgi:hypothetical protein